MNNDDVFSAINFEGTFKNSASRAGQRYSVFQSPDMPNVKLKYINYLNALTLNNSFVKNLQSTAKHIEEYNYQEHKLEAKKISSFIDPLLQYLYETIRNISIDITDLQSLYDLKLFLEKIVAIVHNRRNTHLSISHQRELEKKDKEHYSYIESKYRGLNNDLYKLKEQFDYFTEDFISKPYMLVIGEAGIGKTHFMLDSTKSILHEGNCILTFLGETFKSNFSILQTIKNELKLEIEDSDLLDLFDINAKSKNTRFLIIIDAVNEIDISANTIKDKLDEFISLVKKYENIAVVFSCRTPYQFQVVPDLADYFIFELPGLPQEEALKQFSLAFNIQPIELPYIVNELANPLFLKTMYETITLEKNRDDSVQVSSLLTKGNESLKELFEKYIFEHSINIFKHKRHRLLLWNQLIKPICKLNFESLQRDKNYELIEDEVVSVIDTNISTEVLAFAGIESAKNLLELLVNIGIFRKDIDYRSKQEVIKITYQKLYDYLMARYIFEVMPKKGSNSKKEITNSYEKLISDFNYFSFIEAIIVEFPTRNQKEELFDYLSKGFFKQYGVALLRVFINGLLWRSHSSFTDRTKFYINKSLSIDFETTLETLFILSTKPSHPFTEKTFSFLEQMSIKERDLILSTFLRYRIDSENPIGLYIEWLYDHDKTSLDEVYVYNLFNYLIWFLTLPVNDVRDKITHILVELATFDLKTMFKFIQDKHDVIDDGYIRERLIGSLYGAMMRLQLVHNNDEIFRKISLWLYDKYFNNFTTYHIVELDYVKSIIELSLSKKIEIRLEIDLDKVFNFKIEKQNSFWSLPSYSKCKEFIKSDSFFIKPMHNDFTNKTIGKLFRDRPSYGHSKEYNRAVLCINNRVYELGWNEKDFDAIDREYNNSYDSRIGTHSIERYGKKYSWIAYYEYVGYLISMGKLNPKSNKYDDIVYDRFWEKSIDVSFPNIKYFIKNKPFVETLSFENIKKQLVSEDWIVVFAYGLDRNEKHIEYLISTSLAHNKPDFNSLGQSYTSFMGELFWSENLPKCEVTDICLNYSSSDYNTHYSSNYDIVLITMELAISLGISVDLLNNQFIDRRGRKAIEIYKYSDSSQTQEFTLLRRDLLKEYLKSNNINLFCKLEMSDLSSQENDQQEIITLGWKKIEITYWLQKVQSFALKAYLYCKKIVRLN